MTASVPPVENPWSEERRHRCEVAYMLALPDHAARARYLVLVTEHRGAETAERLRAAAWARLRERCA